MGAAYPVGDDKGGFFIIGGPPKNEIRLNAGYEIHPALGKNCQITLTEIGALVEGRRMPYGSYYSNSFGKDEIQEKRGKIRIPFAAQRVWKVEFTGGPLYYSDELTEGQIYSPITGEPVSPIRFLRHKAKLFAELHGYEPNTKDLDLLTDSNLIQHGLRSGYFG